MGNLKMYIQKNIIFVSILSIFLVIISGIGIFYIVENQEEDVDQNEEPPTSERGEVKKTNIASFSGTFTKDDSIQLLWSISEHSNKVQKIELYHGKTILADVSNLLSYELPLSSYQLSTGSNKFVLKAYLNDGKIIEREVVVPVDYVLEPTNEIVPTDGGYLLRLSYKYSNSNPVGVPSITFTYGNKGNASKATSDYQNTTTEVVDGVYTRGITQYFLNTSQLTAGDYAIHIRYFFKDVGASYDFKVDFSVESSVPSQPDDGDEATKPQQPVPPEQDDNNPQQDAQE